MTTVSEAQTPNNTEEIHFDIPTTIRRRRNTLTHEGNVEYSTLGFGDAFAKVVVETLPDLPGIPFIEDFSWNTPLISPSGNGNTVEDVVMVTSCADDTDVEIDVIGDDGPDDEIPPMPDTLSQPCPVVVAEPVVITEETAVTSSLEGSTCDSPTVDTSISQQDESQFSQTDLGSIIEASDVGSLLQQFEEASASIDSWSDASNPGSKVSSPAPTPPPTPGVIVKKVRSGNKRKAAIMLPSLTVPSKKGKPIEVATVSRKIQKILGAMPQNDNDEDCEVKNLLTPQNSSTSSEPNSVASSPATVQEQMLPPVQVNENYFHSIPDHDYCQNYRRDQNVLNNSLNSSLNDNCVLKNLTNQKDDKNGQSFDLDVEDEEEETFERFSKFHNEQLVSRQVGEKYSKARDEYNKLYDDKSDLKEGLTTAGNGKRILRIAKKNYRNRENETEQEPLYDKLPTYMTALSKSPKQNNSKDKQMVSLLSGNTVKSKREASPSKETLFDKLPAYYSCFTNSTKYDGAKTSDIDGEPLDDKYPWDRMRTKDSVASSRSSSPLVIDSRAGSRSNSISKSRRNSRSRSPHSRSRSRSRSRYSRRRHLSRSRRHSRARSRSHSRSRHSYSRSRSRTHRSRSRLPRSRTSRKGRYSRRCSSYSSGSSRSRSRSYSKSRSRSRSYSRSRSRSYSYSRSRSRSYERLIRKERAMRKKEREMEKKKQIEERRIVYVGKIPSDFTRRDMRRRFDRFGDIEDVSVHFRNDGDNYGFVTFYYTCDAYAAIDKGNSIPGEPTFDLCFGGRREFCKDNYADLDGEAEIQEEQPPFESSSGGGDFDFDALLKQAQKKIKKK